MVLIGIVYETLNVLKVFNNVPQISLIISWSMVALILLLISTVFWLDMKGRKEFLARILANSDLTVSDKEVIRYAQNIEEEPSEIQTLMQEVKELHALIQSLAEGIEVRPKENLISDQKLFDRANSSNTKRNRTIVERIIQAFGFRNKQK